MIEKKFLIHTVLGHSYLFTFAMFLVGLLLDRIFPFTPKVHLIDWVGFVVMILGTFLIVWAQHTSDKTQGVRHQIDKENAEHHHLFHKGPYKFSRLPTHIGMFLVFFGFGFLINSFFVPITALVAFLVSKILFVRKQEKLLTETYGESYKKYKTHVKF